MAKIIPINQKVIDSCKSLLASLDESFRDMSFEERLEKYESYLNVKEIIEDLLRRAQGNHEPHQDQEEINETKA